MKTSSSIVALLSILGSAAATTIGWTSGMWVPAAVAGDRGQEATVFQAIVTPGAVAAGDDWTFEASVTPTTGSDGIFPYGDPVCTMMQGTKMIPISSASTSSAGSEPTDSATGYTTLRVDQLSNGTSSIATTGVAATIECTWPALTGTAKNVYNGAAGEVIAFAVTHTGDTALAAQTGYTIAAPGASSAVTSGVAALALGAAGIAIATLA